MQERSTPAQETAESYITAHWGYLLWIVRQQHHVPEDDAADVVQTACLKLWQQWDTWEDRGRTRDPWAAQIASNAAKDWWRGEHAQSRDRRLTRSLDDRSWLPEEASKRFGTGEVTGRWAVDPAPAAEELVLLAEELAWIWRQLTLLERYIALETMAGYTRREIGAHHGKTAESVKASAFRMYHRELLPQVIQAI